MEPQSRVGSASGFSGWHTGILGRVLQGPGPAFTIPTTTKVVQGSPGLLWFPLGSFHRPQALHFLLHSSTSPWVLHLFFYPHHSSAL